MDEYRELNSDDCFEKKMGMELYTLASTYLQSYIKGFFSVVVSKIDGAELGMKCVLYGNNTFGIYFYNAYIKFIYDGLYLILSDNSLYSEIGKSSHLMQIPSLDYNSPKTYYDFKLDLHDAGKAKFDNERQKLHAFLYKISTMLLVIHECQHILNGHNGLLKANNINRISKAIEIGLLTTLDSQTLEMDADCNSIISLVNILKKNIEVSS